MKKINFVTSFSPQQQYRLRRWFLISTLLCACSLIISLYCVVPELLVYMQLKNEVAALRIQTQTHEELLTHNKLLTQENDLLRTKKIKIERFIQQPKNPHTHLVALINACNDHVKIENIRCNTKNIDCVIICPTLDHAMTFMQQLSESGQCAHVKLSSLEREAHTKLLRCTINLTNL